MSYLLGKFPGGSQDQGSGVTARRLVYLGEQGEPEGEGLAGTGRGLAGHVLAGEDVGDGGCLDGKGLDDALFGEGADERVG